MKNIHLKYGFYRKPVNVLLTSFVAVTLYQGFYYMNPANQSWIHDPSFSWLNALRFMLIDQVLIECITVAIIFTATRYYARLCRLETVMDNAGNYLLYFLKFLPLFLLVYFFFAPFTLTVRYVYHYYTFPRANIRFRDYIFLKRELYVAYLVPVMMIGYGTLILNFLIEKAKQTGKREPAVIPGKMVIVKDEIGELPVQVADILWIKKDGRKNIIKTFRHHYFTSETLNTLEKELREYSFVRINRGTLVPLTNIKNYSFWENEKYILRTKDGEEFTMTRERLKNIKERIKSSAQ
jgi:two-component system, LytTR family, response regulator